MQIPWYYVIINKYETEWLSNGHSTQLLYDTIQDSKGIEGKSSAVEPFRESSTGWKLLMEKCMKTIPELRAEEEIRSIAV